MAEPPGAEETGATPTPPAGAVPRAYPVVPVEAQAGEVVDAAEQSQRLAWQVAVDAAGVGPFDWDITTGVLFWDERFAVLFGHDQQPGLRPGTSTYPRRVHPQD